jgi:hypothetical protein
MVGSVARCGLAPPWPPGAAERDGPIVGTGLHGPGSEPKPSDRPTGLIVHPIDRIDGEPLEQAFVDHCGRSTLAFLGRLEDEVHRAREIRVPGQIPCGAEQHRRVAVMTAGMHFARYRGLVGEPCPLFDVQGVHICPEGDGALTRLPALQGADDAGSGDADMSLDSPVLQLLGHERGGSNLFKPGLGMGVDVATDGDEFAFVGLDPGQDLIRHHAEGPRQERASIAGRSARSATVVMRFVAIKYQVSDRGSPVASMIPVTTS